MRNYQISIISFFTFHSCRDSVAKPSVYLQLFFISRYAQKNFFFILRPPADIYQRNFYVYWKIPHSNVDCFFFRMGLKRVLCWISYSTVFNPRSFFFFFNLTKWVSRRKKHIWDNGKKFPFDFVFQEVPLSKLIL